MSDRPDELYWSKSAGVPYEPAGDGDYYAGCDIESELPDDAIRYVPAPGRTEIEYATRILVGRVGRTEVTDLDRALVQEMFAAAGFFVGPAPDGTETEQP